MRFGQYTRRTVVRRELGRTRANSARIHHRFANTDTPPNSGERSPEYAERSNGSPENSFAGGKPSTSNERSPRTGPPRTTFADGELQFAKKHILDRVNDRSPRTVVRQRRTSSLGEIKF